METKATMNFGLACFCAGTAVGILMADHLPKLLVLGIDIVLAAFSIFLIFNSLKILRNKCK